MTERVVEKNKSYHQVIHREKWLKSLILDLYTELSTLSTDILNKFRWIFYRDKQIYVLLKT